MKFSIEILNTILTRELFYLDPGSGSFILQIVLASFLGALFAVKLYWKKIKTIFKKPAGNEGAESDNDSLPPRQ
jgi:hypothetical protein